MKFAILLAATIAFASPLAYRDAVGQQVDSASKVDSASRNYPSLVRSGSIVRFMFHGDPIPFSGELSKLTPDSVILHKCFDCSPNEYGRNAISDLEVYRGSTYGRNVLFGFFGGAVGGGALAAVFAGALSCSGDDCAWAMIPVASGVLVGAIVGTVFGIMNGKEIWDPVR